MHVHVSKGKPTGNSTKIWLTKSGGCILANNLSKIPNNELNKIMEINKLNKMSIEYEISECSQFSPAK